MNERASDFGSSRISMEIGANERFGVASYVTLQRLMPFSCFNDRLTQSGANLWQSLAEVSNRLAPFVSPFRSRLMARSGGQQVELT